MTKSTAIWFSLTLPALLVFLIVSSMFTPTAAYIDTVHWVGNPLPPCFVDAKACGGHVLGTDEVGRDMVARLIVGTRTSLIVSLFAIAAEVWIALTLALIARRLTFVRSVVQRAADALSSISPWPFLAIIAAISFGARGHASGIWLTLWAAIVCWPSLCRFMLAGWSPGPLLRKAAHDWANFILLFVTVDFFGWGVQPPTPSLGNMLVNMQANMQIAWWVAVLPGICLFLVVLPIEIAARAGNAPPEASSQPK